MDTLPDPREVRTDRLLLRRSRLSDVDEVFAFASDEEYARFYYRRPVSRELIEHIITWSSEVPLSERPHFAVVCGERVVGEIYLWFIPEDLTAELGYGIAREYWGEGVRFGGGAGGDRLRLSPARPL